MTIGIPEFDMVLEASRHLQETEVRRAQLVEDLKSVDAEEKFWRTELYLRIHRLNSATNTSSPKISP